MIQIDEKLSLFQTLVSCSHDIIFTVFRETHEISYCSRSNSDVVSLFFSLDMINTISDMTSLPQRIHQSKIDYKALPYINTNSLGMIWIAEPVLRGDEIQGIITIGPVFSNDYSMQNVSKRMDLLQVPISQKKELMAFTKSLPVISMTTMCQYGTMLHYCLYEEKIGISDLCYSQTVPIDNDLSEKYVFAPEKLWNISLALSEAVEKGNRHYDGIWREYLSLIEASPSFQGEGLRGAKDRSIILTADCTSAAIKGGLAPATAYLLSGNYISAIEGAQSIAAVSECRDTMLKDFVSRVHRLQTASGISPRIRSICEQVQLNPEKNYDLKQLAESVGYSEYYFTKKFRMEMGLPIKEYLLQLKMNRAKQLLDIDSLSIQEIADQLSFNSQSYFTKCFKSHYGITPSDYRQKKEAN